MLTAGPHAETIAPLLAELDMRASIVGPQTGAAAAIKMIRSVLIKGIEALTLECFLAAARAGVLDEVTASLKNNYPGVDWAKMSEYNLERMASHGERRAAEMEESAATLRELGIEPVMVDATVSTPARNGGYGQVGSGARQSRQRPPRYPRGNQRVSEGPQLEHSKAEPDRRLAAARTFLTSVISCSAESAETRQAVPW